MSPPAKREPPFHINFKAAPIRYAPPRGKTPEIIAPRWWRKCGWKPKYQSFSFLRQPQNMVGRKLDLCPLAGYHLPGQQPDPAAGELTI